jgi:hypothetical protein
MRFLDATLVTGAASLLTVIAAFWAHGGTAVGVLYIPVFHMLGMMNSYQVGTSILLCLRRQLVVQKGVLAAQEVLAAVSYITWCCVCPLPRNSYCC